MASDRQIAANRRNAARSTGPKTAAGKTRSRLNALKHGLACKALTILPNEDPAQLDDLRRRCVDALRPADRVEEALVELAVKQLWRMLRAQGIQAERLERDTGGTKAGTQAPDAVDTVGNTPNPPLTRYSSAIERAFYRTLSQLERHRAGADAQLSEEPDPPPPEPPRAVSARRTRRQTLAETGLVEVPAKSTRSSEKEDSPPGAGKRPSAPPAADSDPARSTLS